ncbi:MAG: phosphoenolpyruvate--protein phosphotransferase [Pseudomonadota bacterium]
MSLMFNGIGVSRGIEIAPARTLKRDLGELRETPIERSQVTAEIRRFQRAIKNATRELTDVQKTIPESATTDIRGFIETHLLMLSDDAFVNRPKDIIREQLVNAEWAVHSHRQSIIEVFEAMEDPYLATRKNDVNHVADSVLRALQTGGASADDLTQADWRGVIVIADDLTPADTVHMQTQGVAGFITETGGHLSHTAILARSLGIPAIVGVHEARRYILDGEELLIDGSNGLVAAAPDDKSLADYRKRQREQRRASKALEALRDAPAKARSGEAIGLFANIEIDEDVKALRRANAIGVGLYRTEFLYMNRDDIPTEEEHYRNYTRILRALRGAPLTIRTVDLGADKEASSMQGPLAHNPALGLRGIRRSLKEPALFVPQLRAILRAASKGPVNILLPMLTSLEEVRQARALIAQTRDALRGEGYKIEGDYRIGGMIEVPAAAIAADQFAAELDFLSIGTNDLIQYTLAIDRIDDHVNYLYDPLHPAVLMLVKAAIDAGNKRGIPVSLCGEMAGEPRFTRLLLGLGLRDFSMPVNSLLATKNVILNSRLKELRPKALAFVRTTDGEKRKALLEAMNSDLDLQA